MSLAERSRREVERRLGRLREEYGAFPVETETVENDPEYFEHGVELIESGRIGGAGALVRDADDRVLLGYHIGAEVWGWPGGGHDPGESLEETAVREVREETDVRIEIRGVWHAIRRRFVHEVDPERRASLVEVVFVGISAEPDQTPDASADDEIAEAGWFSPGDLPAPVVPPSASARFPPPIRTAKGRHRKVTVGPCPLNASTPRRSDGASNVFGRTATPRSRGRPRRSTPGPSRNWSTSPAGATSEAATPGWSAAPETSLHSPRRWPSRTGMNAPGR
jgi:8-oxo-dGTP pyrophosphatase MutT (NUDIX family)